MPVDDRGVYVDARTGLERVLQNIPLARMYAWGPRSGDWDQLARWQVRWQWPWGGWPEARSSVLAPAPWATIDAACRAFGAVPGVTTTWTLAPGDDPDHALLFGHRAGAQPTGGMLELDAERAPTEVHRPGGDPFPEVEAAARVNGHWYVATIQAAGELPATVVWMINDGTAREVARVPRTGFEARPALRIARRTDGHALGLVVDGQPDSQHETVWRWVLGIDLESGAIAEPEPLAPKELNDRAISLCTGDDGGWVVELPYPGQVRFQVGGHGEFPIHSAIARMRISRERACVERMFGSADGSIATEGLPRVAGGSTPIVTHGHAEARSIDISVSSVATRYGLRCWRR